MRQALLKTTIENGELASRGKVRDIYVADEALLLVATDRISAFDCVLESGIPGRGIILTQLSNFWFGHFADRLQNHILATSLEDFPEPYRKHEELRDRSVLVRRLKPIDVECVVRGYLSGSGWKEYLENGEVKQNPPPPLLHPPMYYPGHHVVIGDAPGEAYYPETPILRHPQRHLRQPLG